MLWLVYNVLFAVAYAVLMPRFLFRMWRRGGYRKDFFHRFGIYSPKVLERLQSRRRVWIHAVSVGEVYVALRFLEDLRKVVPGFSCILTTTTSTGHKIAEEKLSADDVLLYFPTDVPFITKRVLKILRPKAILLTECELWPNLIRLAGRAGIPVVLINGRISESSYQGYHLIRVFMKRVLASMRLFLVQSAVDEERLRNIGADPERIKVVGSAKYDMMHVDPAGVEETRRLLDRIGMGSERTILLGGSTWAGEEEILLEIYAGLRKEISSLRLVLVPRHAERKQEVEAAIAKAGLSYVRRSELQPGGSAPAATPDVLLVDTTGELRNFYALASVIFVGKSLCATGGQNFIEPALWGKPIIVGPHLENFTAIADDFLKSGAMIMVNDRAGLESAVRNLAGDRTMCERYGKNAKMLVEAMQGAVRRSVEMLRQFVS